MEDSGNLKTIERGILRRFCGQCIYSGLRYLLWLSPKYKFAKARQDAALPYLHMTHESPLLRSLKDIDMQYQYNKITNLELAAKQLDGVLIYPGETFSYWRLIGKPTKAKGYLDGMMLSSGKVITGVGGGLCQLSNLIYWMTLHTPLTVSERHRHGYDVFPDAQRTQPFGSGATCFYPHGDLMITNNTPDIYQLRIHVGSTHLHGAWHASAAPEFKYEIIEKDALMQSEWWGGYSRHNALYCRVYDLNGSLIDERLVTENHAMMMYEPFLADGK